MSLQVGNYGVMIEVRTLFDLNSVTRIGCALRRPDGTVATRAIPQQNIVSLADGIVNVPVQQGDLTMPGNYMLQLSDETTGRTITSEPAIFYVGHNLMQPPFAPGMP